MDTMPIIVISGKTDIKGIAPCLEKGPDDYITKPFDKVELQARIKAVLRRTEKEPEEDLVDCLSYGSIRLDPGSKTVFLEDASLQLTKTEYKLLIILLKNPKTVLSRERLYQEIWGEEISVYDNSISVHISNLRHKLKEKSGKDYIHTHWGVGCSLE